MDADEKLPSFAPYGVTMSFSKKRLEDPIEYSWSERLIAKMWEKTNVYNGMPNGVPIIARLLHTCGPTCKPTGAVWDPFGDGHAYTKPAEEDVKKYAALVQWLATSVGSSFIHTFLRLQSELNGVPKKDKEKALEEILEKFHG